MPIHRRFFIYYLILFLPLIAMGEITKISNFQPIRDNYSELCKDYSPSDILVIFEAKNVIFKSLLPSLNQLSLNKAEIKKVEEILKTIKPSKMVYLDTLILTEYKHQLLDPTFPEIVQDLQSKKSPIIVINNGLTGNFNKIKNLEIWKAEYFKNFNLNFSSSFPLHKYLVFNNLEAFDNTYPTFYHGILSSNNTPIFQLILNFLIEVKYLPKAIVMVSNNPSELKSVKEQLTNYDSNIAFIGYYLAENSKTTINSNSFIPIVEELAKKTLLVKLNNITIQKKDNINPYENKE